MGELKTHDVVEIEVNGETHTGVVRNAGDDSVKIALKRHAVSETVETDDLWAEDDTAYVVPELVTFVGRPDTETLHPQNYSVEQHVDRLEDEVGEGEVEGNNDNTRCLECNEEIGVEPLSGKRSCPNCERSYTQSELNGVATDGGKHSSIDKGGRSAEVQQERTYQPHAFGDIP